MKAASAFLLLALCFVCAPDAAARQGGGGATAASSYAPPAPSMGGDAAGAGLDQQGIKKYLLGPGDVMDLRVFGEPDFSGALVVNDEGNVEVPFIDEPIAAKCRTDREIKAEVVKALARYLKRPQVSLRVVEMRSRPPAVVFGAVRAAQRVQMQRRAHLLELLAFSGGVTEQAGGSIQVFHTEPLMCPEPEDLLATSAPVITASDDPTKVPFELYDLAELKNGNPLANPVIRPGDIVIVQEAAPVYITGAVISPQGIYMRDTGLPLTRAIAMVGGLRKEAKASAIRVYRLKPKTKEQEILTVDFNAIKKQKAQDFMLQPYDVIEVTDNSGSFSNTVMGLLKGTIGSTVTGLGTNLPLRVLY